MTRKLSPEDARATNVLSVRLAPATREALDREAARRSEAAGGVPVSAAVVARILLEQALVPRPATVPDVAPQSTVDPPPSAPVAPSSASPIVASDTVCARCHAAQVSMPCAEKGCARSVLVCACEDSDVRCPDHRSVVAPVVVSRPFAPSPASTDLHKRLAAAVAGGTRKRALARALECDDKAVRRWLDGGGIDPSREAAIDAALTALGF